MGPRSIDRGKRREKRRHNEHYRFWLQWGRDQLIAESEFAAIGAQHSVIASMGPRSIDRGKPSRHQHGRVLCLSASMGPRSIDRGKRIRLKQQAESVRASMGPRSIDRGKRWKIEIADVVQTASMGPRSIDRGKGRHANYSIINDLHPPSRAPPSRDHPSIHKHLNYSTFLLYFQRASDPHHFPHHLPARGHRSYRVTNTG